MSAMLSRAPGTYVRKHREALLQPCEFQHTAEKKHKLGWLRQAHLQRTECVNRELHGHSQKEHQLDGRKKGHSWKDAHPWPDP